MGKRVRTRRMTSYHEAGHAVAARKLGIKVVSISMVADKTSYARVRTYSARWMAQQAGGDQAAIARSLYSDMMVYLAGVAADQLAGYRDDPDDSNDGKHFINSDDVIDFAPCRMVANDVNYAIDRHVNNFYSAIANSTSRKVVMPSGFVTDINNAIDHAMRIACFEAGLPEPRKLKPSNSLMVVQLSLLLPVAVLTASNIIMKRAWTETTALLQDNWRAVVRVAGVLGKLRSAQPSTA